MSYDPTERAPQNPGQPPAQPPVTPPAYGQAPQPPAPPAQEQYAPTQYAAPPAYNQPQPPPAPAAYGQSNPGFPPYSQTPQPGQSNPGFAPYGQPQPGQSNPGFAPYGQPQPGQSNPGFAPYGQPQPGQSNPGLPQYGQPSNPSLPPYGAPADPYAPQQPWGASVPPGYTPPTPPKKSGAKPWVIILVVLLILAIIGGGVGAYIATRPKPAITVTSQYQDGSTYVGAASTSFTLKGSDFSGNSAITFLLDGNAVPGAPAAQSDSNGVLKDTTLAVTSAWSVGSHTLTAKDASGYVTKTGVKIEIVTPGQAKTPGPNGAPTDSANISIVAIVVAGSSSGTANLVVTGSANGGTVCRDVDDGKPRTHTGEVSGVSYTETMVSTCSGTYKGGKLDYTENVTTDKVVFVNGLVCTAHVPYVGAHLQGTFTSGTAVNGDYSEDAVTIDCNLGAGSRTTTPNTGTWTGVAVVH